MTRQGHREWEPLFKSILFPLFTRAGAEVRSSVRVGARELEIDLEVRCDAAAREALGATTPFDFFLDANLIEAKLMNDRLTVAGFQRAVGRAWLYLSLCPDLEFKQVQTVALCSRHPRTLLNWLSKRIGFDKMEEGHYLVDIVPAFHILSLGKLPLESRNYLLALFTTGRRRKEVVQALVLHGTALEVRAAYELYPREVKEAIHMAKERFSLQENLEFIVEDMGRDRVLDLFSPEERLRGLSPEELLRQVPPEERLRGLPPEELLRQVPPEERLRGLSPEELLRQVPPEELLRSVPAKERLKDLAAEDVLAGLSRQQLSRLRKLLNGNGNDRKRTG